MADQDTEPSTNPANDAIANDAIAKNTIAKDTKNTKDVSAKVDKLANASSSVDSEESRSNSHSETNIENEHEGSESTGEADTETETEHDFELAKTAIVEAAELAKETKDYLSYATVLDVHLSKPELYTSSEKVELLKILKNVLNSNDELVYQIGWDLPQLLLQYTTSYNDYDFINRVTRQHAPFVFEVAGIFSILSTKGNAKELFLKAAEVIYDLRIDDPDAYIDGDAEEDGVEKDDVEDNDISVLRTDSDDQLSGDKIADSRHERAAFKQPETLKSLTVREQYFDLRFSLYFELLKSCLIRIKVKYPSRFVATASTVLLSCLANNLKDFTVRSTLVFTRRMFIFARDFDLTDLTQSSEAEKSVLRKLLQGFVTWTVRLCLDRFSVKWSHRLFYEMKAGLAHETDPRIRESACTLSLNSRRLDQALGRLAMIGYTFDFDLYTELRRVADKAQLNELNTEPSDDPTVNKNFTNLSDDGLVLMATQAKSDHRNGDKELSFAQLVELTIKLLNRGEDDVAPLGIQDAVCFWGMWVTEDISAQEVQEIPKIRFFGYLQQLMIISGLSDDPATRYLINTLIAKLLRLSKPEVAFEYLVDTITYCPFKSCKDASIRMLKAFTLKLAPAKSKSQSEHEPEPKSTSSNDNKDDSAVDQITAKLQKVDLQQKAHGPFIDLDKTKILAVQDLIQSSVDEINGSGNIFSDSLPVLLSWLNFAVTAPLEDKFVKSLLTQAEKLTDEKEVVNNADLQQELSKRKTLVQLATASVRKAHTV